MTWRILDAVVTVFVVKKSRATSRDIQAASCFALS
jgi:hypothetical protein